MVSIREANEQDLPDILTLYKQPDMDGDCLELEQAERIFQKIKTYPDYGIYVAEADGRIVGTFSLAVLDNLVHLGSNTAVIESVVVAADYQGKGIGKAMMTYAMDLCREKKCYKVSLSSGMGRKNAHRFYENLGFKIHGYSFMTQID
jgi:GNAT superfamily N-acetyltransferase